MAESDHGPDILLACLDAVCGVGPFSLCLLSLLSYQRGVCRYSLLLVFYAAALSDTRSRIPMRYATVVNSIFLAICVTISLLMKDPSTSDEDKKTVEIVYFTFNALLDLLVVIGLSYFGYKFGRKQSSHKTVATRILPRSPRLFSYVNWVLVAMSALRGFFNIALITLINRKDRLEMIYYHSNADRHMTPYYIALYFFAVEIVPVICIFVTLWKRPSSRQQAKRSAPPSTAAERAAANSIDEQPGVVVKHYNNSDSPAHPAPPAWWSATINSVMGADATSGRDSDGPSINEDASDDDYMMFKGVVHTGSATGDAVQIPNWTRNQLLMNSSSLSETGSLEKSGSFTYTTHSGGPISISIQPKFLPPALAGAASSPLVGAAGTPPSFDTWMKHQQRVEPGMSTLTAASPSVGGALYQSPGSPVLVTPYTNANSFPESNMLPPRVNVDSFNPDGGSGHISGISDNDFRGSARMSAVSQSHRVSDSSYDSACPDHNSFSVPNNLVRAVIDLLQQL